MTSLLAGLVWLLQALLSWGDPLHGPLFLLGILLATVAVGFSGYLLALASPTWLRAVVSVATPALALTTWVAVCDLVENDVVCLLGAALLLLVVGRRAHRKADEEAERAEEARVASEHRHRAGRRHLAR